MTITPRKDGKSGKIGVGAKVRYRTLTVSQSAVFALVQPFNLTVDSLHMMASLIERRSTEGLTGPVGMGKIAAQQAELGIAPFIGFLISISVALGLFNLLPFPALDGGRLVFLGYEVITRRRPNERFEATVHAVGLVFLLGVIALVTLRDIAG
jgi:regulator of sigma E protease